MMTSIATASRILLAIVPLLPVIKPATVTSKDKKASTCKRFEAVYTVIRDDLLVDFRKHNMPVEAIEYYRRIMDYNVPGRKLNRGLSVVDSVAILKGHELTETEYFKAAILGWFVEWLQAYTLVSDDIVGASVNRGGKPCWYRVEGVGLTAINDAFILQGGIFQMIRKYFRKDPFYVDLVDLMHEVSYQTEMRQPVDLITSPSPGDRADLEKFNFDTYRTTVLYRTSMYSFYLPVALALLLCGFPIEAKNESDPNYFKIALDILLPLGEYSQIREDYLDYAGTTEQIGKVGTDIMDNKCSWCISTALAHANPTQRAILEANYGLKDVEAEGRVKEIFREVGVDAFYAEYEAEAYARIDALIDAVPEVKSPCGEAVLRRSVFRTLLEKIYGRTK